jgi:hypothetical protein
MQGEITNLQSKIDDLTKSNSIMLKEIDKVK